MLFVTFERTKSFHESGKVIKDEGLDLEEWRIFFIICFLRKLDSEQIEAGKETSRKRSGAANCTFWQGSSSKIITNKKMFG